LSKSIGSSWSLSSPHQLISCGFGIREDNDFR
jgi:hypothetical protein